MFKCSLPLLVCLPVLTIALGATYSPSAGACAEFDYYHTEVTESDAPSCLEISGDVVEEVDPVVHVTNRCAESVSISEQGAASQSWTVAVDASETLSFPKVDNEVLRELTWSLGAQSGALSLRIWTHSEMCPDTGLKCTVSAVSGADDPAVARVVLFLLAIGALTCSRRRSAARRLTRGASL